MRKEQEKKDEEDEIRDAARPLDIFEFGDDIFSQDNIEKDVQMMGDGEEFEVPMPETLAMK